LNSTTLRSRHAGFEVLFRGELTYFYTAEYDETNPDAIERAVIDVHRPRAGFLHMGHALLTHDTLDRQSVPNRSP